MDSATTRDFSSNERRILVHTTSGLTIRKCEASAADDSEDVETSEEDEDMMEDAWQGCDDVTHAEQLLGSSPSTSSKGRLERPRDHDCSHDLCNRIHNLTAEMLTAPIERPYVAVKRKAASGRASLGGGVKTVVRNVREFFEELKKELGNACHGTLFNSAVTMTSLACGVSMRTASQARSAVGTKQNQESVIIKQDPTDLSAMKVEPAVELDHPAVTEVVVDNTRQKHIPMEVHLMKKYGNEWGEVVRHFVNGVLNKEGSVAVVELYDKLTYAYADFPMEPAALYTFLKVLGFSYKMLDNRSYITLSPSDQKRVKDND